jgi:hypothetical protein
LGCTGSLHCQSVVLTRVCFLCRASSIAPFSLFARCFVMTLFRRRLVRLRVRFVAGCASFGTADRFI